MNGLEKGIQLEIYNALKMKVYCSIIDSDKNEIDLTTAASGVYLIKYINSGKTFSKRIVKE